MARFESPDNRRASLKQPQKIWGQASVLLAVGQTVGRAGRGRTNLKSLGLSGKKQTPRPPPGFAGETPGLGLARAPAKRRLAAQGAAWLRTFPEKSRRRTPDLA
jgi:hypothetical protein